MPPPTDPDSSTDFAVLLCKMNDGHDNHELTAALRDAVAAVRDTGRPAKVTYVVEIKPVSKDSRNAYTLTGAVTRKLPSLPRGTTIVWTDPEGNLHDQNPAQRALFDPIPGRTTP